MRGSDYWRLCEASVVLLIIIAAKMSTVRDDLYTSCACSHKNLCHVLSFPALVWLCFTSLRGGRSTHCRMESQAVFAPGSRHLSLRYHTLPQTRSIHSVLHTGLMHHVLDSCLLVRPLKHLLCSNGSSVDVPSNVNMWSAASGRCFSICGRLMRTSFS